MVVGGGAQEGPAPRPPLRLGVGPTRRGDDGNAPRRRRRLAPRHVEWDAGHGAVAPGGRARGPHARHRVLRARGHHAMSDPVTTLATPMRLDYQYTAGLSQS